MYITVFKHIRLINKCCFVYLNKSARRIVTPSQIIPKTVLSRFNVGQMPRKQSCGERTHVHTVATGAVGKVKDVSHIT